MKTVKIYWPGEEMLEGRKNTVPVRKPRGKEGYQSKVNLYNFVIFQNYDDTSTAKALPRSLYNKLCPENV